MPRLSAAPITLTPEQEADLRGLARAHKTPRKLAERAEMILRSTAGTEVREIARQLGVWPKTVRHWRSRWLSGQAEAAPSARLADQPRSGRAGDVCARAGLRDRGAGLRTTGKEQRAAAQSLEPERTGPRGGQARHRRQHLARLGRALFKKRPTSNHISCAAGSRPSRTLSSRANAPRFARSIMRRLRLRSRTSARCRSTK